MDCSIPGFPVLHHLPELAQTHVYWVSNAIQPSHPLRCPLLILPSVFLRSGSFPVSQLFTLGGQKIGDSESASVLPMYIQGCVCTGWLQSCLLRPSGLQPSRLLCPWDSPGKNTGVGCHARLQGIFLAQGSNLHLLKLLHCRWILHGWATGGEALNIQGINPKVLEFIILTQPPHKSENLRHFPSGSA